MNNINTIYYNRIDISEGIDVNRTSESKEFDVFQYWYFLSFKFQPDVSNKYDDFLMVPINLRNIAISNIHDVGYCCINTELAKAKL